MGERLGRTMDYTTQFGLAQVGRWDDDSDAEATRTEAFLEAQRTLQPAPQVRDEIDAEYDVGKRKHKPKKIKQNTFLGKSAFDDEERRRQAKGKGGGKFKGKGKNKGKGKGKGKDESKGKTHGKSKDEAEIF